MKISNKITAILCDDVRQEVGNKSSLMGIYDKDIFFTDLPALLPKLCLYVRLEGVGTAFQKCKITLKAPEEDPIHLEISTPEITIGQNVSLFSIFSPFRAKKTGHAKFEIRFDDRKRPSHVHKFEIKKASGKENSKET
jgi:hypothetical protein